LCCPRRGRGDRAVGSILPDTLRGCARDYGSEQRQYENQSTDNSCKLPIHSEFSKGE
jgi:hypothetical protein